MTYPDFEVQIIRNQAQWRSGLASRLALGGNGIGLFASPAFEAWLPDGGDLSPLPSGPAVAADECGQLLWLRPAGGGSAREPAPWELWLYDALGGTVEELTVVEPFADGAPRPLAPDRLWATAAFVWLFDRANARVLGFARPTCQLVRVVELRGRPLDVAFDGQERFYALEVSHGRYRVGRYDARWTRGGRLEPWRCLDPTGTAAWIRPVALTVAGRRLWILDGGPADGGPRFVGVPLGEAGAEKTIPGRPPPARPCGGGEPGGARPPGCETVEIPRERRRRCRDVSDEGLEEDLRPVDLAADHQANLLVVFVDARERPRLVQFDTEGSLLGEVELPTRPAPPGSGALRRAPAEIHALVPGPRGRLHLVTDLGLARFTPANVPVGQSGTYYTRTLDNGREDGTWHRLALRAELPAGTRLLVDAVISSEGPLRETVDGVIDDPSLRTAEKRRKLETHLGPRWVRVADLQGPGDEADDAEEADGDGPPRRAVARRDSPANLNHDLLFTASAATRGPTGAGGGDAPAAASGRPGGELHRGRYLWLRLTLSSFDERCRPSVRELQVVHPRTSYLRYLPATFQEVPGDPSSESPSRDFLERFLSLFETFLWGLDVEIDRLFEYVDPDTAPPGFLPWLAGWLHLGLEEDWEEARKRTLVGRAWELYERKGTPRGLRDLIELAAGPVVRSVRIVEDARLLRPLPLSAAGEWRLGRNTFVRRGPPRGFRLGDSSVLGRAAVRGDVGHPADPFAAAAHRFTVFVYGDPDETRRSEPRIRRLIDENKPAHTVYALRLVGEGSIGPELRVGVNTRLAGGGTWRLGGDIPLGRTVAASRVRPGHRLGSATRPGRGLELS